MLIGLLYLTEKITLTRHTHVNPFVVVSTCFSAVFQFQKQQVQAKLDPITETLRFPQQPNQTQDRPMGEGEQNPRS